MNENTDYVAELAQAVALVPKEKQEAVAALLLGVVQGVLIAEDMQKTAV